MYLRYDWRDKIDLTLFKKQFVHFMRTKEELIIDISLEHFLINIDAFSQDKTYFSIFIFELSRNSDGLIIEKKLFSPKEDARINYIEDIQSLFDRDDQTIFFLLYNIKNICEKICSLILILNKLSRLIAFV